ncbi:phosphoglycerate mutase [Monoraphidium neglectum]|uniref:phosphoglycerate mutase (2,3-diphosphoglycerate-independent) n=1 Tax=Monoraphidium neglectum TaxID=145388 RepID=A0A0D2MQ23_9CHLO|nr:phosphoglycerate mutase [Monoraphidium neglectum]KIZ04760.1 phosphoglycerate mutase [Monoraphidium neglectum]|eukprot:XP_013903779.1 phosphoglycerate mutase [Monoraphidium neglectum]
MAPSMTLAAHPTIPKPEGPVMVCILDGWGVNVEDQYNAVFSADTPNTDALKAVPERYRSVKAHGTAVGLPSDADMGNSEVRGAQGAGAAGAAGAALAKATAAGDETADSFMSARSLRVGHNALGSGQVVDQGARLVDIALETGKMYEGAGWKLISEAFADHTVHFIGLLSDGGVHSRYDQLVGCIKGAVERGAKRIRVHVLTDGRDVPDGSSVTFVQQLEEDLAALADKCDAKIASGGGRMNITMDRYELAHLDEPPC